MIKQAVESLKEVNDRLSNSFSGVAISIPTLESSDGSNLSVNLDVPIPETFGGIRECNDRIRGLIGLVEGISKLEPSAFSLVPKSLIIALPDSLIAIETQLDEMLEQIENVKGDGGLRDVGEDLIIHSVNQKSHLSVDLKGYYQLADNQVDQALKGVHEILSIINPESFDPFSGALASISALKKEAQETLQELASLKRNAKTNATQAENLVTSTTENLTTLETQGQAALTAANKAKETTEEHASKAAIEKAKVTTLLGNITATEKKALTLEGQVNTLQPTFEAFQKKLDDRDTTFKTGEEEFDKLRAKMLTASEENDKLIEGSKEALGWTTAEGLASSFATSAGELLWPMRISRWGFYASVCLLFASGIVAFNGFPWLIPVLEVPSFSSLSGGFALNLSSDSASAGVSTTAAGYAEVIRVLTILSIKIAVLFPALLLVGFTSRRHRALFHQHQLYTYKKTIASALPGFRKHAESHQEAMAAAAFARLLFNPQEDASRDLTRDAGGQWWLSKWLERVISKGVKSVMANDGKG